MRIQILLNGLMEKNGTEFVIESFKQFLHRKPNPSELTSYCLQLSQGIGKSAIIKKILNSPEAMPLYQSLSVNLANSRHTIAQSIGSFISLNIPAFIIQVYQEILGSVPSRIDLNKARLLSLGIMPKTSFISMVIESKYSTCFKQQPIKGMYSSALQWATQSNHQHVIHLHNEEAIHLPFPRGLDSSVDWGSLLKVKKVPQPYVAFIPQGSYWGEGGGAIIAPDGKLFTDLSQEPELFNEHKFPFFLNRTPPSPLHRQENIAVLRSKYDQNYFHWMYDVAARLELLRLSNLPIDRFITSHLLPYQDEILTLMGIPKEKRIQNTPYIHMMANHLIAPSYTGSSLGIVPRWASEFLRRELLLKREVKKIQGYERLYISRKYSRHRRVVNEEEVVNFLKSRGFKTIILENESIDKKVQIFNSAEVIVSPHGAGLTHLLFCQPGTKVIDIFNPNWIVPCYWMISCYFGLDYFYLLGEGVRSGNPMDLGKVYEDILVNIAELSQTLNLASL